MKKSILFIYIIISVLTIYSQVPDSPILVLPPEEASVVSLTPTLEWEPVSGADCYFIYITTDTNVTPPSENCMTTNNSYTVPVNTLVSNETYYWFVQAHNISGWSIPSQYFSFTTMCPSIECCIHNLMDQVNSIVLANSLAYNQANILNNRLESAINQLNLDHRFVAILNMLIFKFRVNLLRNADMMEEKDALALQYSADGVIDLIETLSKPISVNFEPPREFRLQQNYPNPFNPVTTIEYTIPENSNVTLKIYDLLGREVKTLVNKYQPQGSYIVNWDASGVSSGIYIYKLTSGNYTETKKMILSK